MRPVPLIMLAGLLVAGCAGNSVDCAVGSAHGNCAPGTEGHRQMLLQQQDDRTVAEIDDGTCRAYALPETADYAACRRKKALARQAFEPPAAR